MGEIWVTRGEGGEGDALLSRDLLISWSWLEEVSASLRSLPTVSTQPTLGTSCRYVVRHTRVSTGVSRAAASLTLGVAHRSRLSSTPLKVQSQRDKPRGTPYTMLPLLRLQCWLISTARVAPDASHLACGWLQFENRARKSPCPDGAMATSVHSLLIASFEENPPRSHVRQATQGQSNHAQIVLTGTTNICSMKQQTGTRSLLFRPDP